ncbi:MAG: cation transporting ATPase C-terminal domain-containing protein [Erysipelotrichaceae bacterium]|nr:cation transporting ATPase C-terminal domain-containing protein [Erysipelotrichaceae bacterium]
MVIYVPMFVQIFEFEAISLLEYAVAIGLALFMIPMVEAVKYFQRKSGK